MCSSDLWYYFRGRAKAAALVYLAVFIGTCIWALAEVGMDFWLLSPRVLGPAVIAALVIVHLAGTSSRKLGWGLAGLAALGFGALFMSMTSLPLTSGGSKVGAPAKVAAEDWTAFGRTTLADGFTERALEPG